MDVTATAYHSAQLCSGNILCRLAGSYFSPHSFLPPRRHLLAPALACLFTPPPPFSTVNRAEHFCRLLLTGGCLLPLLLRDAFCRGDNAVAAFGNRLLPRRRAATWPYRQAPVTRFRAYFRYRCALSRNASGTTAIPPTACRFVTCLVRAAFISDRTCWFILRHCDDHLPPYRPQPYRRGSTYADCDWACVPLQPVRQNTLQQPVPPYSGTAPLPTTRIPQ